MMKTATSIRQLVTNEKPLITPLAHDALSARLIERAGFKSIGIGGSALLAARYGLPDIGLAAFGEMLAGVREILAATRLPLMVDGDDGYGDVKSVAHMVESYTDLGVSAIVLEDQIRVAKQPGDAGAVAVASIEEMTAKIKVAVGACAGTEVQIIARCDALKPEGLENALRRADSYLAAGANGIFIPGLATVEQLATVGRRFRGSHLMAAQFEGRETWLPPAHLYELGFRQIALPGVLLPRIVHCIDQTLAALSEFAGSGKPLPAYPAGDAQRALEAALQFDKWKSVGDEPSQKSSGRKP
jgi:2-methylisocitrate lyase-like PEP mutase family enzyme